MPNGRNEASNIISSLPREVWATTEIQRTLKSKTRNSKAKQKAQPRAPICTTTRRHYLQESTQNTTSPAHAENWWRKPLKNPSAGGARTNSTSKTTDTAQLLQKLEGRQTNQPTMTILKDPPMRAATVSKARTTWATVTQSMCKNQNKPETLSTTRYLIATTPYLSKPTCRLARHAVPPPQQSRFKLKTLRQVQESFELCLCRDERWRKWEKEKVPHCFIYKVLLKPYGTAMISISPAGQVGIQRNKEHKS